MVAAMPDRSRIPRRYLAPLAITAVLLVGAAGLCLFGTAMVSDNYDGFVSWFDPLAACSCCGSVVLLLLIPLTWWLFNTQVRTQQSEHDRPTT